MKMLTRQFLPKFRIFQGVLINNKLDKVQRFYFAPSRHFPFWRIPAKHIDGFCKGQSLIMRENWGKAMEKMFEDMRNDPQWISKSISKNHIRGKDVEVIHSANKFEVKIALDKFLPEEINIKLLDNTKLVINAKHEEKVEEHGVVSREVTRQLSLPEDVQAETLESFFTDEGYLVLKAKTQIDGNERKLNIQRESGHIEKTE